MATYDELHGIKPFDCRGDSTSVAPRWRRWRKSFQFYVDGLGITAAARRKVLLLHCARIEVQEIFETLTDPGVPEGEDDDVYKAALRALNASECTRQVSHLSQTKKSMKQSIDFS